ncbi:MAG: hypothetical protein FWC11_04555 [Firmicutes bacterium]|nr:hypothetical protein [Bacillota bacterium]
MKCSVCNKNIKEELAYNCGFCRLDFCFGCTANLRHCSCSEELRVYH